MTGTWRDTLFVWSGALSLDDKEVLHWKGTWVGCEECPDARHADTPSAQAFADSDMSFEVCKSGKKKREVAGLYCYDMTVGSGWDLGKGEDKARHKDRVHTIACKEPLFLHEDKQDIGQVHQEEEETMTAQNKPSLVVAKGRNDFGDFISVGFTSPTRLLLARRYLDDGDARSKWSMEQLYQAILDTSAETGPENDNDTDKATDTRLITPWKTLSMHADKVPVQSKSKRKRDPS